MSSEEEISTSMGKLSFLAGGGESGRLIREFDWRTTSLGVPEDWPASLKTAVRIMLSSPQPFWIGWGPELVLLYNDAYCSILGGKHPRALGRPLSHVWSEVWPDIEGMLETAMSGREGTFVEAQLLIMERFGYPEETYYTFSYTPIPKDMTDGGKAGGIICASSDDTARVIGERQIALLRELASHSSKARTVTDACRACVDGLETDARDITFSLLYLEEEDGYRLESSSGIQSNHPAAAQSLQVDSSIWPLDKHHDRSSIVVVDDLGSRFDEEMPGGAWSVPANKAAMVHVAGLGEEGQAGLLIVGLNPYRRVDDEYLGFLSLVGQQVAGSISNAQAYESERSRAQRLTELDRAKTIFFSNISHEFRTPLTLLLGPLEELLGSSEVLSDAVLEKLELAQRNGLRLQKLVNALLDFSRVEAGRVKAMFRPTDLSRLTEELASNFRSACENAGIRFEVYCEPLSELVFVDRDMWERVVLNLLSNAFKFTLEGKITVRLRQKAEGVCLEVADTGVGIAEAELPRLFERFHRIEGSKGRTREGSGIGLALVRQLVQMHEGEVRVESSLGEGTSFFVDLPYGSGHLPNEQVSEEESGSGNSLGATSFVDEAMSWVSGSSKLSRERSSVVSDLPVSDSSHGVDTEASRILLVDDNEDLRRYVSSLLARNYRVQTAEDGHAALAVLESFNPDLVISDVMMQGLDGFELIREIRSNEDKKDLPVILLSARAGEEARVEGLKSGADDYLTKPFSARELLARVDAVLTLTRFRNQADEALRKSEKKFRQLFESLETGFCIIEVFFDADGVGEDCIYREMNGAFQEHSGFGREVIGQRLTRILPDVEKVFFHRYGEVAKSGESQRFREYLESIDCHLDILAFPIEGIGENHIGVLFSDVTEEMKAEMAIRESEQRFRQMADDAPMMVWLTDEEGTCIYANRAWEEFTGSPRSTPEELQRWIEYVHPEDRENTMDLFHQGLADQAKFTCEFRLLRKDGTHRWIIVKAAPRLSLDGEFLGYVASLVDVHDMKRVEARLREDDRRKDEFLATLAHELRNPLAPIRSGLEVMKLSSEDREAIESVRETMEQQTEQLTTLVDDLLEVSRITRGKLELRKKATLLSQIVKRGVDGVRPLIQEMGHRLEVLLPKNDLEIQVDEHRIAQVISNLLNNAAKYTPKGGSIRLDAEKAGDEVRIAIKDSGIGIPDTEIERVFDMFAQVKDPLDPSQSGLGIGLTLVKSLVEMHEGHVSVCSDGSGKGCTFTVLLPLGAKEHRVMAKENTADTGEGETTQRRVLLVDDNPAITKVLGMLVKLLGHRCEIASGGDEAIQKAETFAPDIVFMDIGMPGKNGYEVAAYLRTQDWGKGIFLVALSGWGQAEDRKRSKEAGFDHHIVKPADIDAVKDAFKRLESRG